MRRSVFLFMAALFTAVSASAANVVPADTLTFASYQRDFAGTTLNYRKANIINSKEGSKALVIYLHGGSNCGTDNVTQMSEAGIDSISNYLVRNDVKASFIVPQCPDRTKGWGGIASSIKSLLDFIVRTDNIDPTRIYIFGGSMGGTGTWKILSTYPDYFAAGMPCAANPSGMNATNVATTPVYNVMGLADKVMDGDVRTVAEEFVSQLQSLGDDVNYETVEGWTHEITCIQSYSTERIRWVLSHQRAVSTSVRHVMVRTTDSSDCIFSLSGRKHDYVPEHGFYIENGVKKYKQ